MRLSSKGSNLIVRNQILQTWSLKLLTIVENRLLLFFKCQELWVSCDVYTLQKKPNKMTETRNRAARSGTSLTARALTLKFTRLRTRLARAVLMALSNWSRTWRASWGVICWVCNDKHIQLQLGPAELHGCYKPKQLLLITVWHAEVSRATLEEEGSWTGQEEHLSSAFPLSENQMNQQTWGGDLSH